MKLNFFLIIIFILIFTRQSSLLGAQSNTKSFEGSTVNILLGKKEKNTLDIGLNFSIKKDWKIYWVYPGDAGLPPELKIIDDTTYLAITPSWPYPELEYDKETKLVSRIYKNNILIPYKIILNKNHVNLRNLKFDLQYQICKDICIPVQASLTLELPKDNYLNQENLDKIKKFMNEVPKRYIPEKNETISASKINSNSIIFEYKNSNKLGSKSNIKEVILIQYDLPSLMEKKKKN